MKRKSTIIHEPIQSVASWNSDRILDKILAKEMASERDHNFSNFHKSLCKLQLDLKRRTTPFPNWSSNWKKNILDDTFGVKEITKLRNISQNMMKRGK